MFAEFFSAPNGSLRLWAFIIISCLISFLAVFGLLQLPIRLRSPLIILTTFLGGAYWVFYWLWPSPPSLVSAHPTGDISENIGIWLQRTVPVVTVISNVVAQMLLGLGVYSILRVHLTRIIKQHKDWWFSVLLLVSMVSIIIVGYWDWATGLREVGITSDEHTWKFQEFARDFLFNGLLQQMDAAMFSLVAFYIFSAAYRAFRLRSVESTIMLASAMLIMLSFMGVVEYASSQFIAHFTHGNRDHFLNNLRLLDLSEWVRSNLERPSIRALEFGLGIGGLAIALRIWLGLDRDGWGTA